MIEVDTLIIGAGPSGLALAYRLLANGVKDLVILEATDRVAGLCGSIVTEDGAVFDIGGHSFHTPHPRVKTIVDNLMDKHGGMYYQDRDARILFNGHEIPYPFQQSFVKLPFEELKEECHAGLEEVQGKPVVHSDLLAHLYSKFGVGITDHFMRPYNEKLWKVNLERIQPSWSSERIADSKKEEFEPASGKRKPLQSDTKVGYPRRLGFNGIFEAFANEIGRHRIEFNCKVREVIRSPNNGVLVSCDRFGVEIHYRARRVISTMPINVLTKTVAGMASETDGAEDNLFFTSLLLHVISVPKYSRGAYTPQRLYVHSDDCPAHKIAFNNLSSDTWSQSCSKSIMFETSWFGRSPDDFQVEEIRRRNIEFLIENEYIPKDPISPIDQILRIRFSYPLYTHGFDTIVSELKYRLRQSNIHSIGRFGSWSYMNSDGCINEAFNYADSIS
jgi:protoporphyrinogen oxidase